MVRAIIATLAYLLAVPLFAQPLQLVLQISPNPSPYLSDWQTRTETAFLSVTNPSTSSFTVKVDGKVFRGGPTGQLQANSKVADMPVLTIEPGVSVFDAADIFPGDLVDFHGDGKEKATRTGRIPAGQYTLCVTLVNAENTSQPMSQQRCANFSVQLVLPPQLVLPTDATALTSDQLQRSMFRWGKETPPIPGTFCELVVVERYNNQPVWQAISANPPVFQENVSQGLTQLQWPPDVVLPGGRDYAWSVRVLDGSGRPLTEPEWANPFTFSVQLATDSTSQCACNGVSVLPVQGSVVVGNAVMVKANVDCDPSCIRSVTWTAVAVQQGQSKQVASLVSEGPFTQNAPSPEFSFTPATAGTILVRCVVTTGSIAEGDATKPTQTVTAETEVLVTQPDISTAQPTDSACSLIILEPSHPCVGSVVEYHTTESISVSYYIGSSIIVPTITIYENPCGTYDPPYNPEHPTTTSRPPSSGYKPVVTVPCAPTTGVGSISLPIAEYIKPGGAYIIELGGTCNTELPAQSLPTTNRTQVCWRYRPLVQQTTSETLSDSQDDSRETAPPGITRTPTPEIPKIPAEPIPCDSLRPIPCGPARATDPATPIAATLELQDASVYPYPRATPLRVNAIDFDYAIFKCTGCRGGTAELKRPVRDEIGSITWTLLGKGSLNSPFDATKISSVDSLLAALAKRLAEIKDSITLLTSARDKAVADFAVVREDAKSQLASQKDSLKGATDSLANIATLLKTEAGKIDSLAKKLDSLHTAFLALRDSAEKHQDSIAKLDVVLTNPPSTEERSLLAIVEATQRDIASAESNLKRVQTDIETATKSLQKTISDANNALTKAQKSYSDAQNNAGKRTRKIADLQSSLYHTPALKDYQHIRRDVQQGMSAFAATYPLLPSIPKLTTTTDALLEAVHDALEIPSMVTRATTKKLLDSTVTVLVAVVGSSCASIPEKGTRDYCIAQATDLITTLVRYKDDASTCLLTGELLKRGVEHSIKASQADLATVEPALAAAAAAVVAAQGVLQNALKVYETTIGALDNTRGTILAEVESARTSNAEAQRNYQTVRNRRDSAFAANQPMFINARAVYAAARDSALRSIDSMAIVATQARADSIDAAGRRMAMRLDSIQQAKTVGLIKKEIARLESIVKTTDDDIAKPYNDKIAALQADSAKVEKQLEELKKEREKLVGGNKSADGEFAYYIPPPLEEIMSDASKKKFDDLKDSVTMAETAIQVALAEKETLQGTLAKMLEDIANHLAEIKQLEMQLESVTAELKGADSELADLKNELAKDFRNDYDGLTDAINRASLLQESADKEYVKEVGIAATLAKTLETKEAEWNSALSDLLVKQAALTDATDKYRQRKESIASRTTELSTASNAANANRKAQREAGRQEKRAADQDRRAIAREDLAAEVAARSALAVAKSKTSSTAADVSASNALLKAIGTNLNGDFTAMLASDKTVSSAFDAWLKSYNTANARRSDYNDVLLEFENARSRIEKFRGIANRAKANKDVAEQMQEGLDKPDDAVDNSTDVTAKTEERESLQKQSDELTAQLASLKADIANTVSEKDKLIKEADDRISEARNHLTAKEDELKTFIRGEFEKPMHRDTLKLIVTDKVVDGWRSGDKPKEFVCYIRYDGTRIPALECGPFDPSAPPEIRTNDLCIPDVPTEVNADITPSKPAIERQEPRTIALLYKDGKPLWKEWPVFKESKLLAKDVVVVRGPAADADRFVHVCKPQTPTCTAPPPSKYPVVDLVSRDWSGAGIFRHPLSRSERILWEPSNVTAGVCKEEQMVLAEFTATEIHADSKKTEKNKFVVYPGVLLEVTDSLLGWPNHTDTVVARIVTGNHKGLAGEEIVFIPEMKKGASEDWALDGGQKAVVKTTDGDGYVKIPFDFGKGFARWNVKVRWLRGDTCERTEFPIVSPLHLRFHRFAKASPTIAWKSATKVWEGADVTATLDAMPKVTSDDNPYEKKVHAIAGLLDENRGFVNDQTLNFKPISPRFKTDPLSDKTAIIGIARSEVQDKVEKKILTMQTYPSDTLKPLTQPPSAEKSYNPKGGKRFKIGDPAAPFYVEMDAPFDLQQTVSGPGKLKVDLPNEFMKSLVDLPVTVSNVELDADTVATSGEVAYTSAALSAKWSAFTFSLSAIKILAGIGCGIEGSVNHTSLESPVQFKADLSANGEFYGEISNLPSVSAGGFTLRQGASIALDFHSKLPADAPLGTDFKGIVIGQAELEFPEEFNAKESDAPTVLAVTNLGIGNSGVSGSVSVSGGPLTWGFSKFSISVSKVSLTFKENALDQGSIEGAIAMEKPFSGTLQTTLTFGDKWTAEFTTKSSISIPRWKAVAAIQPGTKLEYDKAKGIGTFTLVAVIQSDKLGRIEINELTYASDGTFRVDGGIKKNVTIKVLKGFDLKITDVEIKASNDDFDLAIHGSFGIPGIGLDKLTGILSVKPGPEFDVEFTGGTITIEKNPFTLEGNFEWKDNAFYADLSVEITNVLKGITGVIFVGTQPTTDNDSYTFWYVGLTVATAIPLGQSGLSITSMGGGIGWNCRPPIGNERPTPENFNSIALRASVGVGNTLPPPAGKVFNSEFVMVYAPGSITLGGSVWLMDQRKNINGDGALTIAWSPKTSVSGFIRTNIAIPDNAGKVFAMRGKVDLLFSSPVFKVESEYLDASLLGTIQANAQFRVTPSDGFIKGKMWYDLNKDASIGIGTVKAGISMSANGELTYATTPSVSVTGSVAFKGNAYLSFENSFTSFDLARAYVNCNAGFTTTASTFKVAATVSAYVSVLGFGGNVAFDLGTEV